MRRIPSNRNPARPTDAQLGDALKDFESPRVAIDERETLWITQEPRMPRFLFSFIPRDNVFALIDLLKEGQPLSCNWSAEDFLEAHLRGFSRTGDVWTDGFRALLYGGEAEMISSTAVIRYDQKHDRHDRDGASCVHVQLQQSPSWNIARNVIAAEFEFTDEKGLPKIRGGEMQIFAIYRHLMIAPKVANIRLHVRGKNPPRSTIHAYIEGQASRAGVPDRALDLKVIGYKESRFSQFYDSRNSGFPKAPLVRHGNDEEGEPVFGPGPTKENKEKGGFGIFQLDTIDVPGGGSRPPSAEEIWNWKKNVETAATLYAVKLAAAIKRLQKLEADPENAKAPPIAKPHHGLTKFTEDQLKIEAYQAYNGGAYFGRYSETAHEWDPNPTGLDRAYGVKCLAIEHAILDGASKKLPLWDDD